MSDLVVIVPSRGRPEAAETLVRVFADTCTADTMLVFALDGDDPTLDRYPAVPQVVGESTCMVEALNLAALAVLPSAGRGIGFMGDDHCPRTYGWDAAYLQALKDLGTGIVYGDDLLQGPRLPTQCAMTSDIVRALGYMAPPVLKHLYVDNYWLDLGSALGRLRYLPDVMVEHRHPVAGKAAWDAGYARVNDAAVYQADGAAYEAFKADPAGLAADVAKVAAVAGG